MVQLHFGGGTPTFHSDEQLKTLMEQLPQLAGVRDTTDHSDRSQAFY